MVNLVLIPLALPIGVKIAIIQRTKKSKIEKDLRLRYSSTSQLSVAYILLNSLLTIVAKDKNKKETTSLLDAATTALPFGYA
jgi:hypothetical protein